MKSCPFCKSERVGLYADMVSGVTFGQCMNCGAQGPPCSTNDSVDVGPLKRWDQWSDDDLLSSVRRLVGEWRKQYEESDGGNDDIQKAICADELSALIDGKEETELPKEPIKYTGHPYCHKCGKSHWMYAECETTNPRER